MSCLALFLLPAFLSSPALAQDTGDPLLDDCVDDEVACDDGDDDDELTVVMLSPQAGVTGGKVLEIEADFGVSGNVELEASDTVTFGFAAGIPDAAWHRAPAGEEMIDPTVGGTQDVGYNYATLEIYPVFLSAGTSTNATVVGGFGGGVGSINVGVTGGTSTTMAIPRFVIEEASSGATVWLQIETDRGHPTDDVLDYTAASGGETVRDHLEETMALILLYNGALDRLVDKGDVDPAKYDTEGYNDTVLRLIHSALTAPPANEVNPDNDYLSTYHFYPNL